MAKKTAKEQPTYPAPQETAKPTKAPVVADDDDEDADDDIDKDIFGDED